MNPDISPEVQDEQTQQPSIPVHDTTSTPITNQFTQTSSIQQPLPPPAGLPKEAVSAGQIVLQWLTYAFWGWTLLALSVLTGAVVANLISSADTSGFTPYAAAAVLVLLPISFACDSFYIKKEESKKSGAEMLVMVIHAVIFALCGIGALITAVFMLVQLLTSSEGSEDLVAGLLTALIIATFYALTFTRTLNPAPLGWLQRSYRMIMAALVGIIIILAIVGPVAYERKTRDDKLINSNLTSVSDAIRSYSDKNNKLPENLSQLALKGDAEKLIEKNLVTYKPITTGTYPSSSAAQDDQGNFSYSSPSYRYELCVTYKEESSNYDENDTYDSYSEDGYETYISTYEHPAGNVCYKLKTDY
jgi:hypothetical protein